MGKMRSECAQGKAAAKCLSGILKLVPIEFRRFKSGYIKGTITVAQDVLPYQTVPAESV